MKSKFGDKYFPIMKNKGDAGYDFKCPKTMILMPNQWTTIDTGISLEDGDILTDNHIELHPRSGLGTKYGMMLRNTTGIVDAGYRDTIKACIRVDTPNAYLHLNSGEFEMIGDDEDTSRIVLDVTCTIPVFILKAGERFMQGVVCKHGYINGLDEPTDTRKGGFGSTGKI